MKLAVVLFNLGGPDSLEAVEPFLRNLFSDPAIISLPGIVRLPLAPPHRQAPRAGGAGHLRQDRRPLADPGGDAGAGRARWRRRWPHAAIEARAFIAMRCWHPFSDEAARGGEGVGPGQDRASAALSAILHDDDGVLACRLGARGAQGGTDRAAIGASAVIPRSPDSSRRWRSPSARRSRRPSPAVAIACCCRRMACPSASSPRAIPINGRSSRRRCSPCARIGDGRARLDGLLSEPRRSAQMDRARDRCRDPCAPARTG